MYVNLQVISNAACAQQIGNSEYIMDHFLCTTGAGGGGPCNVSNVQCLTYRNIYLANFQSLMHQSSIVVRWSDYEVPGSIPGSTVGILLEGEVSHGDVCLGSSVEVRFKTHPGTSYSYITIHHSRYFIFIYHHSPFPVLHIHISPFTIPDTSYSYITIHHSR
jgi:hypothetical protein